MSRQDKFYSLRALAHPRKCLLSTAYLPLTAEHPVTPYASTEVDPNSTVVVDGMVGGLFLCGSNNHRYTDGTDTIAVWGAGVEWS